MHPLFSHQRQVHLDFHTSPFIPDVGCEFDATAFARTMKAAHVNSATIFAKCHHGMCYYPTRTGVMHPGLHGRDLLGEQIEALHREDIRCPIYTTVAWEEDVAQKHPEWRQLRKDGTFARIGNADFSKLPQPGGWRFNNYLHPEYQDYIEAHVREICANYEVDGIFFDIVFFEDQSCWSDPCVRFREKHGLLGESREDQARFQTLSQSVFTERFTRLIHGLKPAATIFYNSTNPIFTDSRLGVRARHAAQTHWELESLGFIYFADPIFREYRSSGNTAVRDGWRAAMRQLIGGSSFGDGLASTILCVPRRRGNDLLLTLLHYIPTRKALEVDTIEERSSFAGQILRVPKQAANVRVFPTGEALSVTDDGGLKLPADAAGRLLLEVPGFFAAGS